MNELGWSTLRARAGPSPGVQAFKRAQILLAADEPKRMGDAEIARAVGVSKATAYNVRSRYLALGVERAVQRKARKDRGIPEKVDTLSGTGGRVEAHLIALACSAPLTKNRSGRLRCWPTSWSSLKWTQCLGQNAPYQGCPPPGRRCGRSSTGTSPAPVGLVR